MMKGFATAVSVIASFCGLVAAASVSGVTGIDCDGYTISKSAMQSAADASLAHLNAGTTVGDNDYPHEENNYEGFTWASGCDSPYYEFPVFRSKVYTGGSPSVDRVIIGSWDGTNAAYCGGVTHQGASGNDFLFCDND